VKIFAPCPCCSKQIKVSMVICNENAAEFLDEIPTYCPDCGDVEVSWDALTFFSVRYRGEDDGRRRRRAKRMPLL
jgi:hypothetical protein